MGIPSNPLSPGTTLTGKISWFGGANDPSAGSQTASGASTSVPGIAVYNQATLGGYWLVTAPNGRQSVVKQTDLGPAPWTGRIIDFTSSSLGQFGYHEGNFPTNAVAKATYLGRTVPANYQHLAQGAAAPAQQQGTTFKNVNLPPIQQTVPTFDQAGYDQALHGYRLGQAIKMTSSNTPYDTGQDAKIGKAMSSGGPSPMSLLYQKGVLRSSPPNAQDFQGEQTVTQQFSTQVAQQAQGAVQQLAGAGHGGYTNPIPGASIGRTDMGVDINLRPGSPVRAIGRSQVLGNLDPNWYAGQPYWAFKLLDGPMAGHVYYIAEQFASSVRAGQIVNAGQQIGTYASSGTGIEIGWADPNNPRSTLAQSQHNTGGAGNSNAPAGANFRSFLGSLGAR